MVKRKGCFSGFSRVLWLKGAFVLVILLMPITLSQMAAAAVSWIATGSLVPGRYGHTATLLPSGKVLVAGGSGALTSAKLYDPATGTWSPTGPLTYGRSNHTATLLPGGKVLVAGGGPRECEIYDPAVGGGTWSNTGLLDTGRIFHTATLLRNGKVLVAGGYNAGNLNSAELYDPATGEWSTAGSFTNGRYSHTATLLSNGQVLVAGGQGAVKAPTTAEIYDPAAGDAGTWSLNTNPLKKGRAGHTATLLPTGKVLVAGGYDDENGIFNNSAELYDPAGKTWTFTTGSLSTGRSQHTATLLPTGKVLVAGGLNTLSGNPNWLASAELYDPATATWSATGSLTFKRDAHTATLLGSGRVLVAGGLDNGVSLTSAELYNRPDISVIIGLLLIN